MEETTRPECIDCRGDGRCNLCRVEKILRGTKPRTRRKRNACRLCDGSGTCARCNGTGFEPRTRLVPWAVELAAARKMQRAHDQAWKKLEAAERKVKRLLIKVYDVPREARAQMFAAALSEMEAWEGVYRAIIIKCPRPSDEKQKMMEYARKRAMEAAMRAGLPVTSLEGGERHGSGKDL